MAPPVRRPIRDELSLGLRREPIDLVVRAAEERRAQVSLHLKILFGYVLLGAGLVTYFYFANPEWGWPLKAGVAGGITLLAAVFLPAFILRVSRVTDLSSLAREISRGDLSRAVQLDSSAVRDDLDELAVAISNMQENLRELVGHIQRTAASVADSANALQHSAEGINAQAAEVGDSVKQIAEGASSQKELVGQASRVINDIAQAIVRTAAGAEESARAASTTSAAAEEGSQAARLAGDKVKKVFARIEAASQSVFAFGEKTQEISKIVDAITQVAQQTNLLALNATIEAARAGEYGRGFAVVADEVRKLAESAGKSAEQISRLAREISGQSANVVTAMKEGIGELSEGREDLTGIVRSMGSITDTAKAGAEKVAQISEAARSQQKSSDAMVKAIEEISRVAQENARSTEAARRIIDEQTRAVSQMASAANELTTLSVELQSIVRRFRLGT
jgi:methyl-accepting chemotaxis protein